MQSRATKPEYVLAGGREGGQAGHYREQGDVPAGGMRIRKAQGMVLAVTMQQLGQEKISLYFFIFCRVKQGSDRPGEK